MMGAIYVGDVTCDDEPAVPTPEPPVEPPTEPQPPTQEEPTPNEPQPNTDQPSDNPTNTQQSIGHIVTAPIGLIALTVLAFFAF